MTAEWMRTHIARLKRTEAAASSKYEEYMVENPNPVGDKHNVAWRLRQRREGARGLIERHEHTLKSIEEEAHSNIPLVTPEPQETEDVCYIRLYWSDKATSAHVYIMAVKDLPSGGLARLAQEFASGRVGKVYMNELFRNLPHRDKEATHTYETPVGKQRLAGVFAAIPPE